MTTKLDHFIEKSVAEKIHSYLIQLPGTEITDHAKGPTIGYRMKHQSNKFATLHGGKSYQSLVIHVDPGNPNSILGKIKQEDIQKLLAFDISEIRKHPLKKHEVFIPLEKLDNVQPLKSIKSLIDFAIHKQDTGS